MTTSTTVNDNNTTTDQDPAAITTTNATINFNNSSGNDTFTTDGTGSITANGNNSTGNDAININGASSSTVNLNNSTGNDDVDITGTTLSATVNDNNSGIKGGVDAIDIHGAAVTATVNLNNSLGNDSVNIVGSTSTNATVNLNNSGGNDIINVGSNTGATSATINLNNSGGTDIINAVGLTANATVNLTNSTGNDAVELVGSGVGTIDGANSTGNNTLIGANSSDTITGGSGNDTVELRGAGTINAGSGNDLGVYVLSDHYGQGGGGDYYYGQGGTNTLRIVLTQEQSSLALVQTALAGYQAFLATHPGANQTYTFNFGGNTSALTVAGWQNLDIALVTATISGNAVEGQTLTATVTAGDETGTPSFQWQELVGASWTNISGETGATYLLKETGEGQQFRVQATYTDGIGNTVTTYSAATAAVVDAAPTVTTPAISGTAQEGQTLTASASAGQSDNPVSYAWYSSADNYANPIGSGASYLVKEGDEGATIEVVATAHNEQSLTASATSMATAAVLDALPTVTTPTISGTAQEGQTLIASASAGQSDNPVSYAWYSSADNYANPIGSGASYLVKEGDEGATIEVVATAHNEQSLTASATSMATAAVLDAAPTVTTPTISGTAQEGQTLIASASAGQSDNPVSYAWYSSADNYANPIGSGASYLVKEGDEGATIEVVATAHNEQSLTASATSMATAAVLDALPTVTTPTISGTAQEGQTLIASASAGQSDNPVSYAWYSSADNYANPIGSGASYLVKEGDEGATIEVVATAHNEQSLTASATSMATAAVLDALPTVTTPTISGTAQEGQTLIASASAGQSDNPVSYAWYSSADNYANPIGSGASYLVKEGDEGATIEVVATAHNEQSLTASATSMATAAVVDAAPTVTTPTISGTAQEGQTLTASASAGQSDNPVSYAWYSSADNYANPIGSGASYLVKEGDEGATIEVVATAHNEQSLTASATSMATAAVVDALPTVTTPTISGTAQEGQTLIASASAGQSDNPVSYAWYSSADNYANPIGSGASYLVKEGDEGATIEVVATAHNEQSLTASATSMATAAVLDALPTVTTPTISGTAQEGQTLTASASAGQSDNPVSYAWYSSADNYANPIGSGASYLVKEGDEGATIEVVATAHNEQSLTASATSMATAAVLDALPTVTTPTISGTAQEGQTLIASASAGQSDNPVSYAWYSSADNYANPIGSGASYLVKEGDEGATIEVVATAHNEQSLTASATSMATAAVVDAAPTVTTPTISGTAQEGQTLTASASAGQSDNPVSYAWYSSADNYANPIGSGASYLVKEGDEGATIEVVATAHNEQSLTASATSMATAAVLDALPTVTTPTISGTAQEGQTLIASASAGQSDNPVSYAWYSSADNYANPIGSGASYLVKEGDEGATIEVVATAHNEQSLTASATSMATAAVVDAAPTVTTPTISGTAQEGQTLIASASAGQSDNPVSYQWMENSGSGGTYQNISGATGSTYVLKDSDGGFKIEVVAAATNDNGIRVSATSATTSVVSQVLDASNTVPGTQSATEGVNKAITGISIADPDATGNVKTTLSVLNGTLTVLAGVSGGLTSGQIVGNGTGTVFLTGSVVAINATLAAANGLVYLEQGAHTSDTLTVATQDQGTSPLLTATSTIPINVTPAGTIMITTAGKNTETVSGTFTDSVNVSSITVTDNGSTITGGTVTINNTNRTWSLTGFPNSEKLSPHDVLVATATDASSNVFSSPPFTVSAPAGIAGSPINLALSGASGGQGGQISMTISGVPSGWNLSQGTNLGNGDWTVQTGDPTALTVTTPATFAGAAVLQVNESWTNADGTNGSATIADNVEAYAPGSPVFAVSDDDALTGGAGINEFVFAQPIGNDTVYNFNAALDTLDLIGFGASSYSPLQPSIADNASGNAVVTLGQGETITLVGVNASQLSASNFVFDQEPTTTNSGTMTIGDGAILPLGGTVDNTGAIALNSTGDESDLEILAQGATLQGGGQIALSDNSANMIYGSDASVLLTNVDNTITGAGQIGQGQLALTNEAAGLIDATGANVLVIDTGANTISNAGTLEATGAGGLVIASALTNSGTLWANGGDVTAEAAVSGGGVARIGGGGGIEFAAAFDAAVSFDSGTSGALKLDQSSLFSGTVAGFATGDAIDLTDVAFGTADTLGYAVNASNTGGLLTVSDGTHTANLALLGQYAAAGFTTAADPHGGTIITDGATQLSANIEAFLAKPPV